MNRIEELNKLLLSRFPNGEVNSLGGYGNFVHIHKDKLYIDHVTTGIISTGFYIPNGKYDSWENISKLIINAIS